MPPDCEQAEGVSGPCSLSLYYVCSPYFSSVVGSLSLSLYLSQPLYWNTKHEGNKNKDKDQKQHKKNLHLNNAQKDTNVNEKLNEQ